MKRVIKRGSPKQYSDWVRNMRGKENEDYRALQNPEKGFLHKALLCEQGYLCGYTMKRIEKTTSHIEHIKPESLCRDEERGSDLNYQNLIACFPKEGMVGQYRYGAQEKGHWWDNDGNEFVSPLQQNCESYFQFNLIGKISPSNNNSNARKTIEILKLDNQSLTEDRKKAIVEFIYGENGVDPISKGNATRSIEALNRPLADGSFVEYCVAIQHGIKEYLKIIEKISKQKKFVVAKKNKFKRR